MWHPLETSNKRGVKRGNEQKKILVIGGSGTVGSVVATQLASNFLGRVVLKGRNFHRIQALERKLDGGVAVRSMEYLQIETMTKLLLNTFLTLVLLLCVATDSAVAASFNGILQIDINYILPSNVTASQGIPSPFSTEKSTSGTGDAKAFLPTTSSAIQQHRLTLTVGPIEGHSFPPEGTAFALSSGSSSTLILQNFNSVVESILLGIQYIASLATTINDPKTESANTSISFTVVNTRISINKDISGNAILKPDTSSSLQIQVFLPPAVKGDKGQIEPGIFSITIDNATISGNAQVTSGG